MLKSIKNHYELQGFLILSIIAGVSYGILQFVIPLYASSIKITDSKIGLICGLAQIGSLVMNLPAGFLIDRFSAGKMTVIGGVLNVLILLAIPFASTPILLVIFLFLEGAARTIGMIALNSAYINRLGKFGYSRAGWLRAIMSVGMNLMAPLISGYMIGNAAYSAIFFLVGAVTFLPVPVLIIYRKSNRKEISRQEKPVAYSENVKIGSGIKELAKNKEFLRLAIFQSIVIAGITSFPTFILLLVVNKLEYSPGTASLMLTFQGIGFILIMFYGGKLIERINLESLYVLGFSVKLAGLILVGFFKQLGAIWAGTLLFGLGTALLTSMSYNLLAKTNGSKGKVAGFYYLFMGAAGVLAPIYCGVLVGIFGIESAFIGLIPFDIAAVAFFAAGIFKQAKGIKYDDIQV